MDQLKSEQKTRDRGNSSRFQVPVIRGVVNNTAVTIKAELNALLSLTFILHRITTGTSFSINGVFHCDDSCM